MENNEGSDGAKLSPALNDASAATAWVNVFAPSGRFPSPVSLLKGKLLAPSSPPKSLLCAGAAKQFLHRRVHGECETQCVVILHSFPHEHSLHEETCTLS